MNPKALGGRVKNARETLGLNHKELAERVALAAEVIGGIECGEITPSIAQVGEIARALRVHPFALLSTGSQGLSERSGGNDLGGMKSPLAGCLISARLRAHLDLSSSAAQLGILEETLTEIENGTTMPTAEIIDKFAGLYPVDAKTLHELALLTQAHPELAARLARLENLLATVMDTLNSEPEALTATPELSRLREKLADCLYLDGEAPAAERRGGYFSIGHLSDDLLQALQDPVFHQQVEKLAVEWQRRKND